MPQARQTLILGLSGADWHLLRPLIDSGRMPFLASLLQRGAHGTLRTLQPQFPPLLWASLATGRRADSHGLLGPFDTRANDPVPLSSLSLRCHALWQQFAAHGQASLIVNWPTSYPAFRQPGACVSDLFFRLAGTPEGLEPVAANALHPESLAPDLAELRLSPSALTAEELAFFVEDVETAAREHPAMLSRLAVALAENISCHAVSLELLDRQPWQLAMMRYDLIDTLGARFMACHPPQLPWVPDPLFKHFHPVMASACRYLDEQLGQLLKRLDEDTLVCVVSERGLQAGELRPPTAELAHQHGNVPWYREYGIMAMCGPGVVAGSRLVGAGLLDLVPTVLSASNLPLSDGLEGRVLAEAFDSPPRMDMASMPLPLMERCGGFPAARRLASDEEERIIERLREIEWIAPLDDPRTHTAESRLRENQFALAMVHLEAQRPHKALPLLENLHQQAPDNERIALHLARCRQLASDLAGARDLLIRVVDHPQVRPHELMELARLHLALAEHDRALACLFRAEQAEGERPRVHARIGEVYLALERFDEAERAFGKALERDGEHALAHLGLAEVRLHQGRVEAAVESALRATELNGRLVAAHYCLGRALDAFGQPEAAQEALRVALSLQPGHLPARRALAAVQRSLGDEAAAAASEREIERLEKRARVNQALNQELNRIRT